jgi:hypothetical protein
MPDEEKTTYRVAEQDLSLEQLAKNARELIALYGGQVDEASAGSLRFRLPSRRGVAAAGSIRCTMTWTESAAGRGDVVIETGDHVPGPGFQHILLLVAGIIGSLAAMLWPFFPSLTPAAGVGAIIAFAAYLLTLRRSGANVVQDLFNRLVAGQKMP